MAIDDREAFETLRRHGKHNFAGRYERAMANATPPQSAARPISPLLLLDPHPVRRPTRPLEIGFWASNVAESNDRLRETLKRLHTLGFIAKSS